MAGIILFMGFWYLLCTGICWGALSAGYCLWGVNWNTALEAGGVLVSEKVNLEFEISAVRSTAAL